MSETQEREWPIWVPLASAGLVVVTLTASIFQRRHFYYAISHGHAVRGHVSLWWFVLFGFIALLPFLLDCAASQFPRLKTLPLWLFPLPVLIGISYFVFHPTNIDFAPFVLVFMTAEFATRATDQRVLSLVAPAASIALMVVAELSGRYQGALIWVVGILFGWFGGYLVSQFERRTQQLRDAQAGLAEKAAADERSRIAREVHDVIAHSMSVTMLHITAARMALENGKQGDALDALREAEQQGRSSMSDIRRTVGLLGPDSSAAAPPLPVATDIPKLVSDFRNAGLDVELTMNGEFLTLAPAAGLSVYRIVQESLTNVAKHAPGATTSVCLTVDEQIRLVITNSGGGSGASSDGSGLGLRGMIERAITIGGDLKAGPHEDGWAVALTAPR